MSTYDNKAYCKHYYQQHKVEILKREHDRYLANPEPKKRYAREHHQQNRLAVKKHRLLQKYGLTFDQFETMWQKQKGLCAICKKPLEKRKGGYTIDHDHKTGQVRGLLCPSCNTRLSALEDVEWRALAEPYLRERL
jgi:hypothetical protein